MGLSLTTAQIREALLESKVVHWRQCQVQKPLHPRIAREPCLRIESEDGTGPLLVICGDYFVEGSFHGSARSAAAAAKVAAEWIAGPMLPSEVLADVPRTRRWASEKASGGSEGTEVMCSKGRSKGKGRANSDVTIASKTADSGCHSEARNKASDASPTQSAACSAGLMLGEPKTQAGSGRRWQKVAAKQGE